MKITALTLGAVVHSASAFLPPQQRSVAPTRLMGYLDNLGAIPPEEEVEEDDSREATKMKKEQVSNFGAGSWEGYVEFNEFDGGDGQMGVAGDGSGGKLEKFDMTSLATSRSMSAKNAWGTATGYAEELKAKGVETSRAQQLENWHNQQEVLQKRKAQRYETDSFDNNTEREDENWRELAKFGVERNQDFDLNESFGSVTVGDVEGTIELNARMNGPAAVYEFALRNPFMGFADFRAAFTSESSPFFSVTPSEGSLMQRDDTQFVVKFKPQSPGFAEGYLVIETEDFKKSWKVVGGTA